MVDLRDKCISWSQNKIGYIFRCARNSIVCFLNQNYIALFRGCCLLQSPRGSQEPRFSSRIKNLTHTIPIPIPGMSESIEDLPPYTSGVTQGYCTAENGEKIDVHGTTWLCVARYLTVFFPWGVEQDSFRLILLHVDHNYGLWHTFGGPLSSKYSSKWRSMFSSTPQTKASLRWE